MPGGADSSTLYGGIDLGGTKIEAAVVDAGNEVRGTERRPTPTSGGPEQVAAEMIQAMTAACTAADSQPHELAGVGVGSPGIVDPHNGEVSSARNLPGWSGTFALAGADLTIEAGPRIRALMAGELSPPEAVENCTVRLTGKSELLTRFAEIFRIETIHAARDSS